MTVPNFFLYPGPTEAQKQQMGVGTPGTPPTPTVTPPVAPLTPNQIAWQNAKTAYEARRSQLMNQYGLTKEGKIDPNNTYGSVRQMLTRYGQQLELARQQASSQGLGHHGLANRQQHLIRYLIGASSNQLGQQFLGQLGDIENRINTLGPKPVT